MGRRGRKLAVGVEGGNDFPGFLGRFRETEEFQILVGDRTFIGEKLEVDHAFPVFSSKENDGNRLHAVRLAQRQGLKQLVQSPETTRKDEQAPWLATESATCEARNSETENTIRA